MGKSKNRGSTFNSLKNIVDRNRGKPPYSYVSLIVMAILESPDRRHTLSGIIEHIQRRFSYYGENCPAKGWKNSIRHNLSLNDCFEKTSRDPSSPSKGHFWRLHPRSTHMFEGGSFMRRKKRFRKDCEKEIQESSYSSQNDVSKGSFFEECGLPAQHDITRVSCQSNHDFAAFNEISVSGFSTNLPLSFTSGGLSKEYHHQQQGFEIQSSRISAQSIPWNKGSGNILLPSYASHPFCLVCAGCSCYY